jgi:hypothetical protein
VEQLLDGLSTVGLPQLIKPFPVEWERQRERVLDRASVSAPISLRRPSAPPVWTVSAKPPDVSWPLASQALSAHLNAGVYTSVSEIGDAENISKSYVSRILRLALLAPDIIGAILAGITDQPPLLEQLERPLPKDWQEQRILLSGLLTEGSVSLRSARRAATTLARRCRRWASRA